MCSPSSQPLGQFRQRRRRDEHRLDLRLLPLGGLRERAAQRVGDHQAEHGVAEKLERLVVDDAAARILVRLRLVRERVLEQPAIAKAIAEARLERGKLLRQRHDQAAAHLLAMALDDAHRLFRLVLAHRDARLAHRVDGERKQRRRRSRGAHRLDAVAVEQRLNDAGLDVRGRAEDDGQLGHVSSRGTEHQRRGRFSTFNRIIVMSSC